ncbi:MAG: alpha/beta hydrolase, partial [Pseudomonadota bacterium]
MPHFTTQDGRSLHYCDSGGAGPAVLCLAGLTRNHRDFEPLAAHLAQHHRVLRLDSRGRGLSDRAVDPIA